MSEQCQAIIYVKDQLRLRRGYGFVMHYNKKQCSRKSTVNGLCGQHSKMESWKFSRADDKY